MPERYPPEDPREWMNRARSNLVLAKAEAEGVYLEDLCFNAQQAVEKAIKALLIKHNVEFPYVHDIAELLTLLERVITQIPESIKRSVGLTQYAVINRYPGMSPPISHEKYEEAVNIAEEVVRWAEERLQNRR